MIPFGGGGAHKSMWSRALSNQNAAKIVRFWKMFLRNVSYCNKNGLKISLIRHRNWGLHGFFCWKTIHDGDTSKVRPNPELRCTKVKLFLSEGPSSHAFKEQMNALTEIHYNNHNRSFFITNMSNIFNNFNGKFDKQKNRKRQKRTGILLRHYKLQIERSRTEQHTKKVMHPFYDK